MNERLAPVVNIFTRERLDNPPRDLSQETPAQQSIRAMELRAEHHERQARVFRKRIVEIAMREEER